MLIGSLVELYVGLHSCLVFLLSKNYFENLARHLLNTLLSVELLKPFSYRNPDSSSILGGSVENAPASSIASRHLVDRSSFCSWIWFLVARYLLNTSTIDDHFLDTYLDSFLDTFRHLHLSRFIEGLYILSSRYVSHFFDLSVAIHLPNTLFLTPNLFLCDFSSFFKILLILVSF